MASIKQRGLTFQVQIRRKDSLSFSKCFKSLSEAKAWARKVESSIDAGNSSFARIRNSNIPSLAEALTRYTSEIVPLKKNASKEHSFINRWKQGKLAYKSLAHISPQDIANHRDELLKSGLTNASVVRHLAVMSHLFTIAIKEWGYGLDNPVLKIRKPKVANSRSRRPSSNELATVLQHLPTDELKTFVQLAIETAMRRSELFYLTWGQVDLQRRTVYLPDTKNGTSRMVIISSKASALFSTLKPHQNPLQRVFNVQHIDTPSKAFGRAVRASRAYYLHHCHTLGIEPVAGHLENLRLHDMRHEATSALFERGLTNMEVASITGHKTLAMLSRYTHLSADHLHSKLG